MAAIREAMLRRVENCILGELESPSEWLRSRCISDGGELTEDVDIVVAVV